MDFITPDRVRDIVLKHVNIDIGGLAYSDVDKNCKRLIFKNGRLLYITLLCSEGEGAKLVFGPATVHITNLGPTVVSPTFLQLYITYEGIKVIYKNNNLIDAFKKHLVDNNQQLGY